MLSYVISLSVLIGIILILRAAFRRSVSPRIMYAVWMIVLIRMLVPFSLFTVRIELPEPVSAVLTPGTVDQEVNGTTPDDPGTVNSEEPDSILPVNPGTGSESQTAPGGPSVRSVLLTVWASGSVAVALFFIISGIRFRLRLKRGRRPTDDFRGVPVYISGCVSVPSVVGVFRPAIFIPAEVEDEMARELILTHEYMHIRHGDQIWSLMRILAVVFYWWNPLVWIAAIMSKRDSELACDESVASRLSRENRYYYARLLLESIPMRQPFALGFGSASMKERISMLTDNIENTSRAIIATVLLISFAFCVFGCSFASTAVDGSGKVTGSQDSSFEGNNSLQVPDSESQDTVEVTEKHSPVTGKAYVHVDWAGMTLEQYIETSPCIFYGKCISMSRFNMGINASNLKPYKLEFEIEEVYKGEYDPQISEFVSHWLTFKVGNQYLIFCMRETSVNSGEDHYAISVVVCDSGDGLYHEHIFDLNLSSLEDVRTYVKDYLSDHPSDDKDTEINDTVTDEPIVTTFPDIEPFTQKPDYDTQAPETEPKGTTTKVESYDNTGETTDDTDYSHSLYVSHEGMKLSQAIGNNYPPDYASHYYGEDGYIHLNLTSMDNINFYTDLIDESVFKIELVKFNHQYLDNVYSAIKKYGGEYGIYSIGIHLRENKVHISTSSSKDVDIIKNILSSFDENSYEIEIGGGIMPQ